MRLHDFAVDSEYPECDYLSLGNHSPRPQKNGCSRYMILMVSVTAVTGFLMGYDLCIVAVVLEPVRLTFAPRNYEADQLFVAILAPGAMISSLIGGWSADHFGRRSVLMTSDVFFICAAALMASAVEYTVLLTGRILLGVAIGMGFVVFPTFMAEVAPPHLRGALITCQEVAQCAGCLSAYLLAYCISAEKYWRWLLLLAAVPAIIQLIGTVVLPESPRWLVLKRRIREAKVALELIGGLPKDPDHDTKLGIVERFLVESPSGYSGSSASRISRVRATRMLFEEADEQGIKLDDISDIDDEIRNNATLSRGAFENGVAQPFNRNPQPAVHILLNLIEEEELRQLAKQRKRVERARRDEEEIEAMWREHRVSFLGYKFFWLKRWLSLDRIRLCRKLRTNLNSLSIAMGCAISQNFTGANTILYYSVDLFKMVGICRPEFAGVMIGVVKLLGVLFMIAWLEKIGRRIPLLIGTLGTLVCHLAISNTFASFPPDGFACNSSMNSNGRWRIAILIWSLMFFWNISWAGLMFVVASEVLPSNFRGEGMGLTIATFWTFAFLFQISFKTILLLVTPEGTFLLLAVTTAMVLLFVFFRVPDLSGKTLEEK